MEETKICSNCGYESYDERDFEWSKCISCWNKEHKQRMSDQWDDHMRNW